MIHWTDILFARFFGEPFGGIIPGARRAALAVLLRSDAPLTGRPLHGLLSDEHNLSSVQDTLKALIEAVIVFGSIAPGEAHRDSDVDLAVMAQ